MQTAQISIKKIKVMEMLNENNFENYLRFEKEFIGAADNFPTNSHSFWDIDTVSSMTVTGTTTSNRTNTSAY